MEVTQTVLEHASARGNHHRYSLFGKAPYWKEVCAACVQPSCARSFLFEVFGLEDWKGSEREVAHADTLFHHFHCA